MGGGAAGIMGALRGVLNNDKVMLFPGSGKDKKKSHAFWVKKMENMPGYMNFKKGIDDPSKETINWINQSDFSQNLELFKNTGIVIIYNDLAKQLGAELDNRGFVITDPKGETNIENLFIAGDLRANAKKQVYIVWDHAVDSLDVINQRIRAKARGI